MIGARAAAAGLLLVAAGCAGGAAEQPPAEREVAAAPAPRLTGSGEADGACEVPDDRGPTYVRRGAEPLDAGAAGVGRRLPDAAFVDVDGQPGSLRGLLGDAPALVVLFTTVGCPVCKGYAPLLEELHQRWRSRGVVFLAVDPAVQDDAEELRAQRAKQGWTFRVTRDPDYALTEALGAERTADAFVVAPGGVLAYRGAIDDQIGINYRRPTARERYLEDAVAAVLAGKRPAVEANDAPGCKIAKVRLD